MRTEADPFSCSLLPCLIAATESCSFHRSRLCRPTSLFINRFCQQRVVGSCQAEIALFGVSRPSCASLISEARLFFDQLLWLTEETSTTLRPTLRTVSARLAVLLCPSNARAVLP